MVKERVLGLSNGLGWARPRGDHIE